MCKWVLYWPRYSDETMQKVTLVQASSTDKAAVAFARHHNFPCPKKEPRAFERELSRQETAYQHDYESEADGYCWREASRAASGVWEEWKLPETFELNEIVAHPKAIILDKVGRRMNMGDIDTIKDREMHVAQGKWLSDAGKYSKGSEGETNGPSGLSFL